MYQQFLLLKIFLVIYHLPDFYCQSFNFEKSVTHITKLATYHYQSNCVIFLYSRENLQKNTKQIIKIVNGLANDLKYSATVAALSFSRFDEAYIDEHGARFMNCNSPLLLIIHSDGRTKRAVEKMSKRYELRNAFWMIFLEYSKLLNFFEHTKTPFDLQIITVHIHDDEFAEFFEVYRVARNGPLRTPFLGRWTMQNGLDLPGEIMYCRRHNLEGIVLKTGSTENYPIHYWDEQNSKPPELKGYFPQVWKELESTLNFTSINFPSVDKVTGMPENSGNWSGLVGMLQREEIDVAVSDFIMDTQRSHVVDFTRPLLKSSYQIFFKNVGNDFNWYSILRPFDTHIWLTIFIWIVIGSLSLTICHSYSCRSGVEKYLRLDDFDPINSALFLTKALCNQGHTFIPSCIASRIIYLCAYLAACVLIPSYSAALISYLTSKTPKRPFDSLDELLRDGTYKLQTNSKTAEYTYFSEASDKKLKDIYYNLIMKIPQDQLPLNTRDGLRKVCTSHHLAHFGDMAVASPYLSSRNQEACEIMYFSQPISTVYSCMALTRNNPYTKVINHFLHKMEDSGIVDVIHDRTFPLIPKIRPSGWSEVEINDVILIFLILLSGMTLSWIIFFIELYYWKIQKLERRKEKERFKYYFKKSHMNRWDFF